MILILYYIFEYQNKINLNFDMMISFNNIANFTEFKVNKATEIKKLYIRFS